MIPELDRCKNESIASVHLRREPNLSKTAFAKDTEKVEVCNSNDVLWDLTRRATRSTRFTSLLIQVDGLQRQTQNQHNMKKSTSTGTGITNISIIAHTSFQ